MTAPDPTLDAIRERLDDATDHPGYWPARSARLESALRLCHEVMAELSWSVRESDSDRGIAARIRARLSQIREAESVSLAALETEADEDVTNRLGRAEAENTRLREALRDAIDLTSSALTRRLQFPEGNVLIYEPRIQESTLASWRAALASGHPTEQRP